MDVRSKDLLASCRHGTLATLREDGHPYASLVACAADATGPILLLSELAEHTRNLRRDPRASLLLADEQAADPLAAGRTTLVGRCVAAARDEVAAAYLAAHPEAAGYVEMQDFAFWRLEIEAARFIGGFGVMGWSKP